MPGAQVQRVSQEEVGVVSLGGGDSGDQPTVPDNPSPPSVVPDSLLPDLFLPILRHREREWSLCRS